VGLEKAACLEFSQKEWQVKKTEKIVVLICAVNKFNMLQLQNADRIEATPTLVLTHIHNISKHLIVEQS